MKIILIGIQGSGKSTQGRMLAEKIHIPYLSTGDIFRNLAKEENDEGTFIREKLRAGILIPDDKVKPIIENYLSRSEFKNGYILDGFPRTLAQAKYFSQSIDHVLYLKLSDAVARERIAKRTDSREDGSKDAIQRRIQLFHEQTEPVIEYYREHNKLIEINGEPSVEEIFETITQSIGGV